MMSQSGRMPDSCPFSYRQCGQKFEPPQKHAGGKRPFSGIGQ